MKMKNEMQKIEKISKSDVFNKIAIISSIENFRVWTFFSKQLIDFSTENKKNKK